MPAPMAFRSILFPSTEIELRRDPPDFFRDLNLDQVVADITAAWNGYDLEPFFHSSLHDPDAIAYRQEVMRDLEDERVMNAISAFSDQMREMRRRLEQANKIHYRHERARWFVRAVEIYSRAVEELSRSAQQLPLASRGLRTARAYLAEYIGSPTFRALV